MGTAPGPGFTIPVVFDPSHFSTTVRSLRLAGAEPKSPYQVPVNGCPSWAIADTVKIRTVAKRKTKRTDFIPTPPLRNKEFRVVDLGLAAEHQLGTVVIVLAYVFKWVEVGTPPHGENGCRPRRCIGSGIIDRRLILQRIHVRTSEALREFEFFGVRRSSRVEPELF